MDDIISRQAAIDMIRNHWSDFSNAANYRTAKACVNAVPPTQPVIIPCDYVKACNEVTMDKPTSDVLYLNVLEELKKHGYVLVDMREVTE